MKRIVLITLLTIMLIAQVLEAAEKEDIIASALFPGLGQIRSGRYGRGSLFASMEVISLLSLVMTEIQYDRAVEEYEDSRAQYLAATYIGDAHSSYSEMNAKWDDAESLHKYRKILLGTAVFVWAVSMADMVWGKDVDIPSLSLELDRDSFVIAKEVSF